MTKMFTNREIMLFNELGKLNNDITALTKQKNDHILAVTNIEDLVKTLKANHNKKLMKIVGGNLITEIDNKESIKDLQIRKEELKLALKTIDEQIAHRNDTFEGITIKIYKNIKARVPKDVLDES